jgi:hypothetical protein
MYIIIYIIYILVVFPWVYENPHLYLPKPVPVDAGTGFGRYGCGLPVTFPIFRTIQGRMLAMLTAAQLPLTYWGEAALTAGFLFNLTVSSTLPKDVTPFEVLKNTKPDVSHLKVWGVRCFAHIPVKLQTKLGAKSCECLFMGYPPSGRGYHLCSLTTNHFFDSGNIIFDENIPYHALHEVSSTPVDYSPLPFPAEVHNTITLPNLPDNNPVPNTHNDVATDHASLLP